MLKTELQVKWFFEVYKAKLSGLSDELTLEGICKQIWGFKYHLKHQMLVKELVAFGGLKQTGMVIKIGKHYPIYKIDQDKMQKVLEISDIGQHVIEIYKDGKIVVG